MLLYHKISGQNRKNALQKIRWKIPPDFFVVATTNQFCKNDFFHLGLITIHQAHLAHEVADFQILGGPGLLCHLRRHAVKQVMGGVLNAQ